MKHLKKLSVALMMTTLFSASFTSCIDNEVSPVVEAIYEAQADLIAAQTAVQNAEASLLAAQAQAEQAQAALLEAQAQVAIAQAAAIDADTAAQQEQTAYMALVHEQQMMQLVAETSAYVAAQENAAALAQANFELQMANLMAQIEAAGVQLATEYAYAYRSAMSVANSILEDKLDAEAELAIANLFQTYDGSNMVSTAYYLAQMEAAVTNAQANKTAIEAAIADMEEYMANPSTPEAMVSALKAANADIEAQLEALNVTMQEQYNKIMAIYDQNNVRDEVVDRYMEALTDLEDAQADKDQRLDWIADAEADITAWETQLADYPAALAALETAVADAETAVADAEAALEAAEDAQDITADALVAAQDDLDDAEDALDALNLELAGLNTSYQLAIQALADETAAYEAGLPAAEAALAAAETDLANAEADVIAAQADYDAKKAAFEADPTGFVWLGGTNGAVGLHADATTATDSYRVVNATDNGVDALTLTAGAGSNVTGSYATYAAFLADASAGALAPGDYYNVGGDDVAAGTHADRLEDAADVLTAALDAIAPLEAAVAVEQDIVDNFGDALAAAQATYDHQKDLYENQLALVAAAEAAVTAAQDAYDTAYDANEDALDAIDDAQDELDDANDDLTDAEGDLTAFEATTEADIQEWIDEANDDIADWNTEIAAIQPIIDAKQAVVDSLQAEYDEYVANTGFLSSLYADLHAEIIAEWQAYWLLEQEEVALENQWDLNDDLIDSYSSGDLDDLAAELAQLNSELEDAMYDIEVAQQALASAQANADADVAYIAYLEAEIATLTARYENAMAIAAKYKALMDAALAS